MPYEWTSPTADTRVLTAWPHNALSPRGFVWVIGSAAVLALVPILPLLGHAALWVVLLAMGMMLAILWAALRRNWRDRHIIERLTLTQHSAHLSHSRAGKVLEWQANPHWVQVDIRPQGGPVAQYLTLHGAGRTVELGAFLTPEERVTLAGDLRAALIALR